MTCAIQLLSVTCSLMWHDMPSTSTGSFAEMWGCSCHLLGTLLHNSDRCTHIYFHRSQAGPRCGSFQTLLNVSHSLWIFNLEPVQYVPEPTAGLRTEVTVRPGLVLFLTQASRLSGVACSANLVLHFSLLSPLGLKRKRNLKEQLLGTTEGWD